MDWHVQFFAAVVLTFMSIVCASKTALATAAITPSGSSTFPSSFSSSSTDVDGSTTKYNNHIQKNNQQPSVFANQGTAMLPHDNRMVFRRVNHTDNGTQRRSYSSSVSASLAAALNGLTKYTGLQHISTSYNPHATSTATVDHHLDASNKIALGAKQQIPIYEEHQEQNDYVTAAAGASAVTERENNQHKRGPGNGHSPLSQAIYNLQEAGVHNINYPPYTAQYDSTPVETTTTAAWNYPRKSLTMDWTPTSESAKQYLDTSYDKNSASNFQHHYEHNSDYNGPSYSYETFGASSYDTASHDHNHNPDAQYYTQNLFQPNDAMDYYSQLPYASNNDESSNYLPTPMQEHGFPSTESDQEYQQHYHQHYEQQQQEQNQQQPPDVINYVPYPLVKKVHVPVRQNVQIPVSHTIIMPIRKPVPIHIPFAQQVQVPIEKDLKIPVERVVPYPVEKPVPVPVEKRVPYPVIRYVAVKVPHPYPIKVPVYKTILHKMKSLW